MLEHAAHRHLGPLRHPRGGGTQVALLEQADGGVDDRLAGAQRAQGPPVGGESFLHGACRIVGRALLRTGGPPPSRGGRRGASRSPSRTKRFTAATVPPPSALIRFSSTVTHAASPSHGHLLVGEDELQRAGPAEQREPRPGHRAPAVQRAPPRVRAADTGRRAPTRRTWRRGRAPRRRRRTPGWRPARTASSTESSAVLVVGGRILHRRRRYSPRAGRSDEDAPMRSVPSSDGVTLAVHEHGGDGRPTLFVPRHRPPRRGVGAAVARPRARVRALGGRLPRPRRVGRAPGRPAAVVGDGATTCSRWSTPLAPRAGPAPRDRPLDGRRRPRSSPSRPGPARSRASGCSSRSCRRPERSRPRMGDNQMAEAASRRRRPVRRRSTTRWPTTPPSRRSTSPGPTPCTPTCATGSSPARTAPSTWRAARRTRRRSSGAAAAHGAFERLGEVRCPVVVVVRRASRSDRPPSPPPSPTPSPTGASSVHDHLGHFGPAGGTRRAGGLGPGLRRRRSEPAVPQALSHPGRSLDPCRCRSPRACRRRRCRPSPTAGWPSGSRPSTTCPSRRRWPPPGARSCTPPSSGCSASSPHERTHERALACLEEASDDAPRAPGVQRARARRRGRGHLPRRGPGAAREVLPPRGPHHDHPDRDRAEARGRGGRRPPPRHHRPPRARRRRRARRHRLQDGPGPGRAPGAAAPRRRGVLLAAVRAAVRPPARQGAAPLPRRPARHHLRAHRPLHPRRGAQAGRRVDRGRAGLRAGGLPPQPGPPVRLVRLQGLLPVLRWRHRAGRRLPRSTGSSSAWPTRSRSSPSPPAGYRARRVRSARARQAGHRRLRRGRRPARRPHPRPPRASTGSCTARPSSATGR